MTEIELPANVTALRPMPKDPTAALRARRARRKRKSVTQSMARTVTASVTPSVMSAATASLEKFNEIKPTVTVVENAVRHGAHHARASRIDIGRSMAVRDAARAAGQAVELIEFPPARRLVEPSAAAPDGPAPATNDFRLSESPPVRDVPADISGPKIAWASVTPCFGRLALADMLAYAVALGLAAIAAWFSLNGLAVLFPGAPREIVVMGGMMEAAKLVACGWLAGAWRDVPWAFRGILMTLIGGLAVINAAGTFSQLTAAHLGDRALTAATRTMQATELDGRIELAAAKVADLDRRIAAIDGIVAGAAQHGRANTAAAIMADQRKARAALVAERHAAVEALAAQRVERGGVEVRAAIAESEAMPIMYAAETLGIGTDPERAIRLLIALMVLCCDPLALALTAAVSVRRGA